MHSSAAPEVITPEIRYIARQPILDRRGQVFGYTLLFDSGPDGIADKKDRSAVRTILDDVVLMGLERLTGGLPAFLRCTSEAITEHLVSVLPPSLAVLTVNGGTRMCDRMIEACHTLKEQGFRIALTDFHGSEEERSLLPLADFVKIDLTTWTLEVKQNLVPWLAGTNTELIAENINSPVDFRRAADAGFQYFQGLYFCYPELIQSGKIPANRLFHLDILKQLQNEPLDLKKLVPIVMRDAALVVRLLRLVNSPLFAVRQHVTSVEQAIILLGDSVFRRVANLAILREMSGDQPAELLHMALVRGRFCQLAAGQIEEDGGEQFLLGLLSLLPAMTRLPMDQLISELPLREEILRALLGVDSRTRALLSWIEFHERNETDRCYTHTSAYQLNDQKLNQFYVDALMWESAMPRNMA